jgi:hypothetical protein
MNELIIDKIIMDYEMASINIFDKSSLINIELLKKITNSNNQNDIYFLNFCMLLIQVTNSDIKLKKKIRPEKSCLLSEEEKHYLNSIY